MNYHNITKDDMNNGSGVRVVFWVSGCSHHCKGCQNQITWDQDDGLEVTIETLFEISEELEKPYISGVTFSGGDPLHPANRRGIKLMIDFCKSSYPNKNIWLYTGYLWEDILKDRDLLNTVRLCDVLVDGPFIQDLADVSYHWAGSTNQRVIDVKKSLKEGKTILHEEN